MKKKLLFILPSLILILIGLYFIFIKKETIEDEVKTEYTSEPILGQGHRDTGSQEFDSKRKINSTSVAVNLREFADEYFKENFEEEHEAEAEVVSESQVIVQEEEEIPAQEEQVEEEVVEEEEVPEEPPINPGACPAQTLGCVPCVCEPYNYCRCEEGEETGYKGWACQNNNPSNIRYDEGGYRAGIITAMGGPAPCGDKGGFLVFSTYQDGRNAARAYISGISAGLHSSYAFCGYGECTLREFFSKYAPRRDQNKPDSYSNYVADWLGVQVDETPMSWIVGNKLDDMIDAIQHKEGYFTKDGML